MLTKTTTALLTAALIGVASAALANDNSANSGETGGSKIGPLGQCFVPNCGEGRGSQGYYQSGPYGFAYVPAHPTQRHRDSHHAR